MAWDALSFGIDIKAMSAQLIHCFIVPKGVSREFSCTCIYGSDDTNIKNDFWDQLIGFARGMSDAWIIMGDFNAIMEIQDRVEGALVRMRDIQAMKCVANCNLVTHKKSGEQYT